MSCPNTSTPINTAGNAMLVSSIKSNKILVVSYDFTVQSAGSVAFYAGNPSAGGVLLAGPWTLAANQGRHAVSPITEGLSQALIVVPTPGNPILNGVTPDLWISTTVQVGGVLGSKYQT